MGQILAVLMFLFASSVSSISDQTSESAVPGKEALLVGDSVMVALLFNPEGLKLLERRHPFIFRAVDCQRLIYEGCIKRAKLSSLALLKANRGKFTNVVVVETGYNDSDNDSFSRAVAAIVTEAVRQGVFVLWLTYREEGNVKKKAISYNRQLRQFSNYIPNLRLLDWNEISKGRDSWFTASKVHLNDTGAFEMARAIAFAIDGL